MMSTPILGAEFSALVGTSATLTHTVTAEDSAKNWGNDLDVLSTPVLLWLSEITAMKVIESVVFASAMTVGLAHDSAHLAPTLTGDTVTITATLTGIDGKKLTFSVEGRDSHGAVLRGVHRRAVVNREEFIEKLAARSA
ncbi:thioesterase family protein [Stenotrophomonas sp. NPDC087984]|uniref:thioesterase family protein n=2 Tax=Streptomyces TaxID=1883 RepID=UPI000D1B50D9